MQTGYRIWLQALSQPQTEYPGSCSSPHFRQTEGVAAGSAFANQQANDRQAFQQICSARRVFQIVPIVLAGRMPSLMQVPRETNRRWTNHVLPKAAQRARHSLDWEVTR